MLWSAIREIVCDYSREWWIWKIFRSERERVHRKEIFHLFLFLAISSHTRFLVKYFSLATLWVKWNELQTNFLICTNKIVEWEKWKEKTHADEANSLMNIFISLTLALGAVCDEIKKSLSLLNWNINVIFHGMRQAADLLIFSQFCFLFDFSIFHSVLITHRRCNFCNCRKGIQWLTQI